eukprot:gene25880-32386_t
MQKVNNPFPVVDGQRDDCKPSCLAYRAKPVGGTQSLCAGISITARAMVGRGSFGHAILATVSSAREHSLKILRNEELLVFKVDLQTDSVVWEAFIHATVQTRLKWLDDVSREPSEKLLELFERYFLPPVVLLLYRDCSAMAMRYAPLGTLLDLVRVLLRQQGQRAFSAAEHEFLVQHVTQQMLAALDVLHRADMIHCDIKADNWVLTSDVDDEGRQTLCVLLIDLGRARTTRSAYRSQEVPMASSADILSMPPAEFIATLYGSVGPASCAADSSRSEVSYCGRSGVTAFDSISGRYDSCWSVECDYLGLVSCVHQLLFGEELVTLCVSAAEATRWAYPAEGLPEPVRVARSQFKRYWDKTCWGGLYALLLNSRKDTSTTLLSNLTCRLKDSSSLRISTGEQRAAVTRVLQKLGESQAVSHL